MFHAHCFGKWHSSTNNKQRDPFNRLIKYKFNFPPKSSEECSMMLSQIKGFIGDEKADQQFCQEYNRVYDETNLDIELDFTRLLSH
nr:putative 17.0 kDa protein [Ectropis obliqua nucleopolyhedrovirus]